MHKAPYVSAILFTLAALMPVRAYAQAVLSPVGNPVTVALPEGGASVLFSNNGAAAIDEEGNIGIAYTKRGSGDVQILDVFRKTGGTERLESAELPFTWRNTPVVTATPMTTFLFTRYTEGDGSSPELATDFLAVVDSVGAASKVNETALNAIRLRLLEIFCTPVRVSYSPRRYVSLESEEFRQAGIFVPTGTFSVGDIYYIHCADGRTFSAKPDWSSDPDDLDVLILPFSEADTRSAKVVDVPPASLPVIAGGQNVNGRFIAYHGRPESGGGQALITVVESDQDLEPTNAFQIDDPGPSLFPGPVMSACGHVDHPHYWVAFTNNESRAVAARIEDGTIEIIDLGDSAHPLDIACDTWGNAVVSWLAADDDFDYFVRTRMLGPEGSVVASHDQPLPPEEFPQPQFAVVSNDVNQAGDIVVAWSNGGFGVFYRRLELEGHFRIDGTLSGSHFNPAFNGEGFVFDIVEMEGTPTLVLYYFTYQSDGSGKMAWLVGSGPIQDNRAVAEVVAGSGATFGGAFDPGDVNLAVDGTVTVTYLACGLAVVEAESANFGSQRYLAQRLTNRPLAVEGQCGQGQAGTPQIDASRGGSHFAMTRNGEGFNFEIVRVDGQPTVVIYYFTYREDGSGDPAWLVGQGPIQGNSATTEMVFGTGGVFGPDFDTRNVILTEWGEITVTWLTCGNVHIEYDGLWGEGSFNVEPLTPPLIGATGLCAP